MKKIISAILALLMLAFGTIAYAAQGNGQYGIGNGQDKEIRDSGQSRNMMRERAQLARANQSELTELKDEIRDKMRQIKNELKKLRRDPEALTEEKIAEIREKLELLRDDRAQLAGTYGLIRKETVRLRLHKRTMNYAGASQSFDSICEIQEERIKALKALSSDLDELLELL
ncbi:hypothetical protein [Phosphitispora sp. TUW77]|uniref:hypothetical protein n=1 Tax=Phosphitispora sp. TUW77 TaxID=3152361 RepID=UPI003AB2D653